MPRVHYTRHRRVARCAIGAGGRAHAAPAASEILSALKFASVLAAQVSTAEAEIMRVWWVR